MHIDLFMEGFPDRQGLQPPRSRYHTLQRPRLSIRAPLASFGPIGFIARNSGLKPFILVTLCTAYDPHYFLGFFYVKQHLDPVWSTSKGFGNWDWRRFFARHIRLRIDDTFRRRVEPGDPTKLSVDQLHTS